MAQFKTYYMDSALFELEKVLKTAEERLQGVDFDTLVGTGFSGGLVIPALALRMGKKFVLIRKDTDDSHDGRGKLVGELGERWIFVDDFISSGKTRKRVIQKVAEATVNDGYYNYRPVKTGLVGQYMYVNYSDEGPHFEPYESDWKESKW